MIFPTLDDHRSPAAHEIGGNVLPLAVNKKAFLRARGGLAIDIIDKIPGDDGRTVGIENGAEGEIEGDEGDRAGGHADGIGHEAHPLDTGDDLLQHDGLAGDGGD